MRKIVLVGIAAALLASLGCAQAADKLRVGVVQIYPPYGVPYAAQELGFYKEAGLDVEITLYRGGSPAQEALASNLADVITVATFGVPLAISKGVKEKIIAFPGDLLPSAWGGWHIVVRKDSPIKTIADLKDKRVGIGAKGSTTDLTVLWALSLSNVTARTIPLAIPSIGPSIKSGQIDAGIASPPFSYRELMNGDLRSIFDFGAVKGGGIAMISWAASDAMIETKPDVLRRWLAANQKAILFLQDPKNEARALAFLKKYLEQDDDRIVMASYKDSILHLVPDQAVKKEWLQATLDLAKQAGVPNLKGIEGIYAPQFVPSWSGK